MIRLLAPSLALCLPAAGQLVYPEKLLIPPGGTFNSVVDVSGTRLAIGAPGEVTIYEADGTLWSPTDPIAVGGASAIALSDDVVLLDPGGTNYYDLEVYRKGPGGWSFETRLDPPSAGLSTPYAFDVDGDTAAVLWLHPLEDTLAFYRDTGAGWVIEQVFGETGYSVQLTGDVAVIGEHAGTLPEEVHVYERKGGQWELFQTLANPGPTFTGFGTSAWTDGARIAVGAANEASVPGLPTGEGAVWIFRRTAETWAFEARLVASDGVPGDRFGNAVALQGERLAVGAEGRDGSGGPFGASNAGAAYLFERKGGVWTEVDLLTSPNGKASDQYGDAIRFDGARLAIAIPGHDELTTQGEGAVETLIFLEEPPVGSSYCTAGTSSAGCEVSLLLTGTPSSTLDSNFHLLAPRAETTTGLFYFGTNGRQATPWGNGSSLQCVVPPVQRLPQLAQPFGASTCKGLFYMDLNTHWCPTCPRASLNPGAGAVTQLQFWYRDPNSTSNLSSSLSNAVECVVQP